MTMTAQELKLDYFQVYDVEDREAAADLFLRGQFDTNRLRMRLRLLDYFANPVSKNGEPLYDKHAHLAWYRGVQPAEPMRAVSLENQFGKFEIRTGRGYGLLVPTRKVETGSAFPEKLDHYKVYQVVEASKLPSVAVKLKDQFRASGATLKSILYFAVPVKKQHGTKTYPIQNERAHLLICGITPQGYLKNIKLQNQLTQGSAVQVVRSVMLAVPSLKKAWKPV